jgi:hypothetical protein
MPAFITAGLHPLDNEGAIGQKKAYLRNSVKFRKISDACPAQYDLLLMALFTWNQA